MQDNIYLDKEAKDKIVTGINKVCEIVRQTYGPGGGNVIVQEDLYPGHQITNDGKTMIDKIKLDDIVENLGANLMRELGDKADRTSGDGRKTTMLLAQAIINEGLKVEAQPLEIKRSLDECLPIIEEAIDSQKRDIDVDNVGTVATIASESPKVGALLQEIYQQIGKEGIVELDNSNSFDTYYEIKEGVRLRNAGFISPYMANEGEQAVYKKPKILITKQKLATINDINPLCESLTKQGITELVIYCDEIDPQLLGFMMMTHMQGIFKFLIIKAPTLWKNWLFEDFAKITGATIVEPMSGVTLKDVTIEHLGTCDKISTTKEETTVIGIKDITDHIKSLKDDGTEESKLRASWLQTKAAILKLGASSESELSYIAKKAKDGRNASVLALQGGVVAGGGWSLKEAAKTLPDTIGGNILKQALTVPMNQILINIGLSLAENDGKFADTIIDPALVVKNAVRNAISVAGTVLTAKAVVTLPPKVEEKKPSIPMM